MKSQQEIFEEWVLAAERVRNLGGVVQNDILTLHENGLTKDDLIQMRGAFRMAYDVATKQMATLYEETIECLTDLQYSIFGKDS